MIISSIDDDADDVDDSDDALGHCSNRAVLAASSDFCLTDLPNKTATS